MAIGRTATDNSPILQNTQSECMRTPYHTHTFYHCYIYDNDEQIITTIKYTRYCFCCAAGEPTPICLCLSLCRGRTRWLSGRVCEESASGPRFFGTLTDRRPRPYPTTRLPAPNRHDPPQNRQQSLFFLAVTGLIESPKTSFPKSSGGSSGPPVLNRLLSGVLYVLFLMYVIIINCLYIFSPQVLQ